MMGMEVSEQGMVPVHVSYSISRNKIDLMHKFELLRNPAHAWFLQIQRQYIRHSNDITGVKGANLYHNDILNAPLFYIW